MFVLCHIRRGRKHAVGVLWQRVSEVSLFVCSAYNLNASNSFAHVASITGVDAVFPEDDASPTDCFPPSFHNCPRMNTIPVCQWHVRWPPATSDLTHHEFPQLHTVNNLSIPVANGNSIRGDEVKVAELCNSPQPDILVVLVDMTFKT